MITIIILLVIIVLFLSGIYQKIDKIEKTIDDIKFEIDNNFFD